MGTHDHDDDQEQDLEYDAPDFAADDEASKQLPLSFWGSISEISRGLVGLIVVSVLVLVLYVAGGVFLGLLTWAAPAVITVSAAIVLARYLSRRQ